MKTLKKWEKTNNSTFTLWNNNQQIGKMEIALATYDRKATATYGDKTIHIKKTGFWKNSLEISDQQGTIIAKVYPEKWYSSSYVLELDSRKYKLIVRNNPLAEWVLQENNQDLLAYGLATQDGKPSVKITSTSTSTNYLFDFILWYLFAQIATEQSGDDLTFLTLIA